jgi:ABC-2 type transport system ATP-binding protein
MNLVIRTHELRKSFGPIHAVIDLDFEVREGEIYGLLGPNGSGKTTLMRLLVGLAKADHGEIHVLDQPIPNPRILAEIGYMTQAEALYGDLTARENVEFFASLGDVDARGVIDQALELVGLIDRQHDITSSLSGGLRQRVSLACALAHRPRLLILDEPTVGVDPQLRVSFWEHFRNLADQGVTLLISSHVMDEAERCDRLGLMRRGNLIAEGTPDELKARSGKSDLESAFLVLSEVRDAN